MKTLFSFKSSGPLYFQIFAETYEDAKKEIIRLMGDFGRDPILTHVTQNYDCPKCSCHATECNAD